MWVCLCNRISNKDVQEAMRKGAKDADDIFTYCNKHPRCGICISRMEDIMKEDMVDVVSIQSSSLGSGPCVFVLERDEKGNIKSNKDFLYNLDLFITEDENDWELIIKRYKITKSKVENLPEFRGW